MHDLCHAAPYIRMSSNPTGGFLIKFSHVHFLGMYIFMCFFIIFCVLFVCFDFLCVFCCCIVLYFFNKTMNQDASLAVGVLSQSRCSCFLRVSSTTRRYARY